MPSIMAPQATATFTAILEGRYPCPPLTDLNAIAAGEMTGTELTPRLARLRGHLDGCEKCQEFYRAIVAVSARREPQSREVIG